MMKKLTTRKCHHDGDSAHRAIQSSQKAATGNRKSKVIAGKAQKPRMTRELAEARAVGRPVGTKFDGTAFLRSLKN